MQTLPVLHTVCLKRQIHYVVAPCGEGRNWNVHINSLFKVHIKADFVINRISWVSASFFFLFVTVLIYSSAGVGVVYTAVSWGHTADSPELKEQTSQNCSWCAFFPSSCWFFFLKSIVYIILFFSPACCTTCVSGIGWHNLQECVSQTDTNTCSAPVTGTLDSQKCHLRVK